MVLVAKASNSINITATESESESQSQSHTQTQSLTQSSSLLSPPTNRGRGGRRTANDGSDDELNIYLNVKSTNTFKIRKSDKIKKLKEVCGKEGVSESLLEIIFAQHHLNDKVTFGEYGINDNSTINLVIDTTNPLSRKLFIKVPTHPCLDSMVVANGEDTIHQVKSMIMAKLRFQPGTHELMYDGRYLECYDQTLDSCITERNPEVYVIEVPKEAIAISVVTPVGKVEFQVKLLHTIGDAKTMLAHKTKISMENSTLVFEGKPLCDSRTFHSLEIPQNAMLELVCPFKIFVKLHNGGIMDIEVLPIDQVDDINDKVLKKLGWPFIEHSYYCNAKKIKLGQNISVFGVRKNSLIVMGPSGCY